jgi:hypothetical protein
LGAVARWWPFAGYEVLGLEQIGWAGADVACNSVEWGGIDRVVLCANDVGVASVNACYETSLRGVIERDADGVSVALGAQNGKGSGDHVHAMLKPPRSSIDACD